MRAMMAMMLLATALIISDCSHQREIGEFRSQLYDATSDVTKTIDAMPAADGVNIASAEFNRKQAELHKQWNKILPEKLIKQDTSDLANAVFRSREKLAECFAEHRPDAVEIWSSGKHWGCHGRVSKRSSKLRKFIEWWRGCSGEGDASRNLNSQVDGKEREFVFQRTKEQRSKMRKIYIFICGDSTGRVAGLGVDA